MMLSRLGARVARATTASSARRSIQPAVCVIPQKESSYQRRQFAGNNFEDAVLAARFKRKSKSLNATWDAFLETGTGMEAIFRAIDLSSNRQISALELKLFVESVDKKGVSQEGIDLLDSLDGEMDETDFLQWLNIATNPPAAPAESSSPAEESESKDSLDGIWKLRAKRKSKLMDKVWAEYLAGGSKDASKIFKTIDLNRNLKISFLELKLFLDSVDADIIDDAAKELEAKAGHDEEDELDLEALSAWLSIAVSK